MIEKLVPLQFQPGLFRNGTKYQAKNRWYTAHLVRWFEGIIAPVGGWVPVLNNGTPQVALSVTGLPRGAHSWREDGGDARLGIGTHTKLYAYKNGNLSDITPAGLTTGVADGTLDTGTAGTYGSGSYGVGIYSGGSGARTIHEADTWTLDNFGELLVACLTVDGKIYSWDLVAGTALQAAGSPTGCHGLVVTPEHFLFALGASGNVRLVAWASQESLIDWTPLGTNTAGDFELATEGRIVCGHRLRRQTLIWTDSDLQAASYVGGDFIYRFDQIGGNCGAFSPHSVALASGAAYWMSDKKFFVYDGAVREIPCDVSDYVFNDLNLVQRAKIWAAPMPQYNEVWWFYPSSSQTGTECDRYVAHNYHEGTWMLGNLARAAGVGRGVLDAPIWLTSAGALYEHESGNDHQGDLPYAESGPIEIDVGDVLARVQNLVPDEKTLGDVTATFLAAMSPTDTETIYGPYSLAQPTPVRFTARQVRLKLTTTRDVDWRVGTIRLGALPAGRR